MDLEQRLEAPAQFRMPLEDVAYGRRVDEDQRAVGQTREICTANKFLNAQPRSFVG